MHSCAPCTTSLERALAVALAATSATISVLWPDGGEQRFEAVAADRHLRLVQGGELTPYTPGSEPIAP